MADSQINTRRQFVKVTAAATLAALASAGHAAPTPDSDIASMYRDYLAARDAYNRLDPDDAETELEHLIHLSDRITMATPCSLHDYAVKILHADNDGDMNANDEQIALVAEARRIVGAH
ncbi:twin-arginine translocation signal domain-containing protein [Sulfitobacter pseudonitzschiae]|uniref:Twin-arginine translocation signal domain-containing protein n=1 Tax=Pseudosulfitobacter pseudonitzschiae TaxID=1402135 RepID=A0A9Q2RWS8_9RHOB|nr:twin-arginine translocation signal domain-containing protein [Pseudosulfitobacter pseudonitzschiae]MBM2293739.1 twin-arginine translocation signal domain-containing protein [Pseudosulfitobacter pseudonitzschiae]MBM2298657.1 twin-arginine translocation signal domain-containing protein [Pseudosulfitobacter pseudonitzschiae]MBM2303571.1 twin-arginine translocation signal domain-containing protein [Pseudosulfitobacter pseudonitzschiae]MBM2313354.1 twin-arginine translocation signal domain-contai